ncbi:MAG: fumarate hydratase [Pseudomonadota bacterium]
MKELKNSIFDLIKKTSTELADDVVAAMKKASEHEKDELAITTLNDIIKNIDLAKKNQLPICQDTGTPHFFIEIPDGFKQLSLRDSIQSAYEEAIVKGLLRDNLKKPHIHIDVTDSSSVSIRLLLKGGGSENVSAQYSLPDKRINAQRDVDGVRRALLDAIYKAQGRGCSPGIIGVCIGADRAKGYELAMRELLRKIDDTNSDDALAKFELKIVNDANSLGIGPIGVGGNSTLLSCKITEHERHPAKFFVSIAYCCWALRRQGIELNKDGGIEKWLY